MNDHINSENRYKDLRILIVDDLELMRELLKRMLNSFNCHDIIEEISAESAVQAFRTHHPDMVLLDLRMPNKDGIEALKEILETDPAAYVVLISGETSTTSQEVAFQVGAKNYITKPYLRDQLGEILDKYLAKR